MCAGKRDRFPSEGRVLVLCCCYSGSVLAIIRCRMMVTMLVNLGWFGFSHPYARAADILGLRLVLQEYSSQSIPAFSRCCIRCLVCCFLLGYNAVRRSSNGHGMKVQIIGVGSRMENRRTWGMLSLKVESGAPFCTPLHFGWCTEGGS